MRNFEIYDEENNKSLGVLLYYQREHTFIVELIDGLDEWTAPFMFSTYAQRGIYTIPRDISFLWVQERIIPSTRQNISSILRTHKLKEYDEMKFLELSHGRCCQDSLSIRELSTLPDYVIIRQKRNLIDCTVLDDQNILCFFADGKTRKIDLTKLDNEDVTEKVCKNPKLLNSCMVGTGGYYITFNDSIDVPAAELYTAGKPIPLTLSDFITFAGHNIIDTQECCRELSCTRQNLAYMTDRGLFEPIKTNTRGNLYLKGDVLSSKGG
ncbi:MAG: hypothetical protein J6O61_05135 [Butyrivibrio sp.]|uniref:hypothetical protein n=1 Tax=Butyrivibrio sp. TaxID=28121 RepID=UPI001B1C6761|nr:hypothetical protein [Butyrivibrio sp.]MBO6240211.1 hypothetical protein [Butyrivibrio sp.]